MAFSEDQLRAWGVDLTQVTTSKRQPIGASSELAQVGPVTVKSRPRKYRNVPTVFEGKRYDSKAEAARARDLEVWIKAGVALDVIRQPLLNIGGIPYRPDFLIIWADQRPWYEDIKGTTTQRCRDIMRLWPQHGRLPLHIRFKCETVIINPEGWDNEQGGGSTATVDAS